MIDADHPLASWYLVASGALFLVLYALPLLFAPLAWARAFRWELPTGGGVHLTVYLGRCLGAVAVAVIALAFRAAPDPAAHRDVFHLIAAIGVLMTAIHAWGAFRRTQPWTEDVEILLYASVAGTAAWVSTTL